MGPARNARGRNRPARRRLRLIGSLVVLAVLWSIGLQGAHAIAPHYCGSGPCGLVARRVPGLTNVVAVTGGGDFSAALTRTGLVYLWGRDPRVFNGPPDNAPFVVSGLPARDPVVAIAGSEFFMAALTRSGRVYAWGGVAGDSPALVSGLPPNDPIVAIAGGGQRISMLTRGGSVYSWGDNSLGQMGNGTYVTSTTAVAALDLPAHDPVIAIADGQDHELVLTRSGALFAWGGNDAGQLGNRNTHLRATPVRVHGLPSSDRPVGVAAGDSFSLALTASGAVYGWGSNYDGELGDGTITAYGPTPHPTPVLVTGLPPRDPVVRIVCGDIHSLALTRSGAIYAWGADADGALGYQSGTVGQYGPDSPTARAVNGLPARDPIVAIGAGVNHSLAATRSGAVYTWGDNFYGQLGYTTAAPATVTPIPAATPTPASMQVEGAGYAFAGAPLQRRWAVSYTAAHPLVHLAFTPTSSAAGIARFISGAASFVARDGPLAPPQLQAEQTRCGAAGVLHLPLAINTVSLVYNLPNVRAALRLSPGLVASLFLGTIRTWNDPRLARLNPGVAVPALPVLVVYRADGSHSTDLLRHYLTAVSPAWRSGPGDGARVRWPVGEPATGSAGLMHRVLQSPGAIGYLDRPDARAGHRASALLSDGSGPYVSPSVAATNTITAPVVAQLMTGQEPVLLERAIMAYPLAQVISVDLCRNDRATADFIRYALTQGQAVLPAYAYGALPARVRAAALAALR